jgi:hypothetical protein
MVCVVRTMFAMLLIMACGRVNFDPPPDTGPERDCSGADGICLIECVGVDPDCVTTCGDGICVGNAGELCTSCAADCATRTGGCGNGACEAGEAGAGCYADCGPDPWPWIGDEQLVVDAINLARTGGTTCPGGSMRTAPALPVDSGLLVPAREWAWERAHQNYPGGTGGACNGRTFQERAMEGGFSDALSLSGTGTAQDALTYWFSNGQSCNMLMDATTTMFVAVGHDVQGAYVVVLN